MTLISAEARISPRARKPHHLDHLPPKPTRRDHPPSRDHPATARSVGKDRAVVPASALRAPSVETSQPGTRNRYHPRAPGVSFRHQRHVPNPHIRVRSEGQALRHHIQIGAPPHAPRPSRHPDIPLGGPDKARGWRALESRPIPGGRSELMLSRQLRKRPNTSRASPSLPGEGDSERWSTHQTRAWLGGPDGLARHRQGRRAESDSVGG